MLLEKMISGVLIWPNLKDLARYYKQFRYLLVCVDVYSRYAFVKPLKNKTSRNVTRNFETILLESGERPKKIHSDEGTEFQGLRKELSKKYNFIVFHTYNREIKASHAERFIRTLKLMIRRTLTVLDMGFNYERFLQIIIDRYNQAPHSSLHGLAPEDLYLKNKKLNEKKN